MHFLIWETLSFNLMYVAACYLVGTGMCHNMVGLLQHYVGRTSRRRVSPHKREHLYIFTSICTIKYLYHDQ